MRRQRGAKRAFPARRTAAFAILLLAFALRSVGLDMQELRGDEAFGYFFSLQGPREIVVQTLDLREPHPVASYWLQHFWLQAAGDGEFALRFSSVWWSVLAVALMLPLASQLRVSPWTGRVAMLLLSLSPYAVWHAQDARMYSMSLALTLASTVCALMWWRAARVSLQVWLAVAYIGVTWLALQTHYFALYVVAAQHIALLGWAVAARAWGKLVRWWLIGGVLLLVWLPWLWAARTILLGYSGNGDSPGLVGAMVRAHAAFGMGESVGEQQHWVVAILILLGTALGAWSLWQGKRDGARQALWFLTVYWLTPLLATWLSALNRPIFNERYLVAAVPPVYMLVAVAIEPPTRSNAKWLRWLGRVVIVALCLTMMLGLARQSRDQEYSKTRGWRDLATTLTNLSAGVEPTQVRLAQNYPDPTLWYYYRGAVPHLVLPPLANDAVLAQGEVASLEEANVGRVLLVEQPAAAWDENGVARGALQTAYRYSGETNVTDWPVSIWLRPLQPLASITVEYENALRMESALVTPTAVPPGALVEVHLTWAALPTGEGALDAVSVQLLDSAGVLVTQNDRPLPMASRITAQGASYAILVPDDAPPGEYGVSVVVYDPRQTNPPRRLTRQGEDAVLVGRVMVTGN